MPLLTIPENLLLFISGVGMLQGFLLANLLYFHPRSDRSVNRFLALFIFFLCIPLLIPIGQQLFSWQFVIWIEPFTSYFRAFVVPVRPQLLKRRSPGERRGCTLHHFRYFWGLLSGLT